MNRIDATKINIYSISFSWDKKGKKLFKDFSVTFETGKTTALIGPNGSGKTTLLELILGWRKPLTGNVYIGDTPVINIHSLQRGRIMAFVPQEEHFRFSYDVFDFVLLGRSPYIGRLSMPSKKDFTLVYDILKKLEIRHLYDRKITSLSGGEKRLVLIARALVQEPDILLLDEPFNHLDPYNREKILQILLSLKKENITLILSSHDPDIIFRIADNCILIHNDSKHISGKTEELLNDARLSQLYNMPVRIAEVEERKVILWGI